MITGKTRYRITWRGKVVLQVEAWVHHLTGLGTFTMPKPYWAREWRDAGQHDLTAIAIGDVHPDRPGPQMPPRRGPPPVLIPDPDEELARGRQPYQVPASETDGAVDPWTKVIHDWLDQHKDEEVTIAQVLLECLKFEVYKIGNAHDMVRVAALLKQCGWVKQELNGGGPGPRRYSYRKAPSFNGQAQGEHK